MFRLGGGMVHEFYLNGMLVLEQVAFNHQLELTNTYLELDGKIWLEFFGVDRPRLKILMAKNYWK